MIDLDRFLKNKQIKEGFELGMSESDFIDKILPKEGKRKKNKSFYQLEGSIQFIFHNEKLCSISLGFNEAQGLALKSSLESFEKSTVLNYLNNLRINWTEVKRYTFSSQSAIVTKEGFLFVFLDEILEEIHFSHDNTLMS